MTTTTDPTTRVERPAVPVENVTRWHAAIADELREAFEACLPGARFTLGPQLRGVRGRVRGLVRRRRGHRHQLGHRGPAPGPAGPRGGARRRGHHGPQHVRGHGLRHHVRGRDPGLRRRRSAHREPRPGAPARGPDGPHEGHPAGAPVRPVRRHRGHPRRGAGHPHPRGRRPRPRSDVRRAPGGRARRAGGLQLLPVQGHGRPRRRRHDRPRPTRPSRRASGSCATWARRRRSTSTWTSATRSASTSCRRPSCA